VDRRELLKTAVGVVASSLCPIPLPLPKPNPVKFVFSGKILDPIAAGKDLAEIWANENSIVFDGVNDILEFS